MRQGHQARRKRRLFRWIALALVLSVTAVTAFFVYHHPPMRLMPAPLIFQGDGARLFDLEPALEAGGRLDIFYATSRLPVGPRDNRIYTVVPDRQLHVGQAELRIGQESTFDQIREWSTGGDAGDRPFLYLDRMRESEAEADWLATIDAELARSRDKDILVYVHGANTTVERAAGQASQLRHFSGRNAVVVLFAWPTAENFLRYPRDIANAFGAAPHLAELIGKLARGTRAEKIDVVTYSAGATVGSDGLARLGREDPEAARRVGEVYHAAPDADFRGFVSDLKDYARYARRVTVAVNMGDSALRLAQVVNRGSRAGRPDLRELSPDAADWLFGAAKEDGLEIVQVHPENMPGLAASSHTFWYDDPWVSTDLLTALLFHLPAEARRLEADRGPSGGQYWTFPPDYPRRVDEMRAAVLARVP